jgi:hypothetical protein
VNTIAHEWRKARKSHHCLMCGRIIDPGERYLHQRNVDCGDIWTWRNCAHCDVLMALLHAINPYRDHGVVSDDVWEWEPETVAQMRLKMYWKMGWRRRDGSLRDVPAA